MKILLIGASGTIGSAVYGALSREHEVVPASRHEGQVRVDITRADSIWDMYKQVGKVDAVVCCAGGAAWKPLRDLTDSDFDMSLSNKLMGQVNVVRFGIDNVRDGGSFTLTSGILAQEPMPGSAAVSLVNAGIEGFVRAAALELKRGLRVNVVSPPWVSETLEKMGQDPKNGMPAEMVAGMYERSVTGTGTGTSIRAKVMPPATRK